MAGIRTSYKPEEEILTEPKEKLFHAAKNGCLEIFERECEQNQSLLNTEKDSDLPIHVAASNGKLEIVKYILSKDKEEFLHKTNKHQQTPLHCAAKLNRIDTISYLLKEGADPNKEDKYGRTPLRLAIEVQAKWETTEELLNCEGTNFDTKDEEDNSLLYTAAAKGLQKVCETLIKEKNRKVAEINEENENALFAVVRNLNGKDAVKMIQCLYKCTDEEDKEKILLQENKDGQNIIAVADGNEEVVEFLKTQLSKFEHIVSVHEHDKLNQVKLYVLGPENVGKTTLIETLKKEQQYSFFMNIFQNGCDIQTNSGINIQTCSIPEAGFFSVREFGKKYLTDPLFTDVHSSVILIAYRIVTNNEESQFVYPQIHDCLRFIMRSSTKRPRVILVATHSDEAKSDFAREKAEHILKMMREQFKDLYIVDVVIAVDARNEKGVGLLRKTLRAQRNSLLGETEGHLPEECEEISKYLAMCKNKFPVKSLTEFNDLIRTEVNRNIDKKQLQQAKDYLLKTGQICVLKDDQVVLSPEWLFNKLLGRLLAPDHTVQRAEKGRYTKHEIYELFKDFVTNTDELIKLLVNLEFCYKKDDEECAKLLIPCKLPAKMPSDVWKLSMTNPETEIVSYARRISCKNMLDRFPSSFFPNVQTFLVVMSEKNGRKLKLWRNGLKGSDEKVDFIIQMSPSLQAVTISVQVTLKLVCKFQIENQQSLEKCHKVLLTLINQVNDTKAKTCPETHTCLKYVSGECLKACEDPSEITEVYLQDELIKAEENKNGWVSSNQDRVDDILIKGCSREILDKLKWESSVKWIPTYILLKVAVKLDQYLPDGHDYRAFAAAIDLDEKRRSLEGKCESITIALLDEWSKIDEKSTINKFKTILERTPIVDRLTKNRGDVAEVLGELKFQ